MGYKVTDTREVSQLTQTGAERKTYRVWLITDNGATGSVDIPASEWNADHVRDVLTAKAASLDLAFDLNASE